MTKVTVHVERRAVCPACGAVFTTQGVPGHYRPGGRACPPLRIGARQSVVVFRRGGDEVSVIPDGVELSGYFTADEDGDTQYVTEDEARATALTGPYSDG